MVGTVVEEAASLLEDFEALQQEFRRGKTEVNATRQALLALEARKEASERRCIDLEREVARLGRSLGEQYAAANDQLSYVKKYTDLRRSSDEALLKQRTEAAKAQKALEEQAASLEREASLQAAERDSLSSDLRAVQDELHKAKRQMLSLEQEVEELKRQREVLRLKKKAKHEAEVKRLEASLTSEKETRAKLEADLRKAEHSGKAHDLKSLLPWRDLLAKGSVGNNEARGADARFEQQPPHRSLAPEADEAQGESSVMARFL